MIEVDTARTVLESVGLVQGLPMAEFQRRLELGVALEDTGGRMLAFFLHEMDVGRRYQETGHSSTAEFAEMRLGIDRRRTSELVGVGRKLLDLPKIDTAFCTRRIGWTKVLALVRVVVAEHEQAWLDRALALTTRELVLETRLARPGSAPRKHGDVKGLPEIRFRFDASLSTLTHKKVELAKQKLSAEQERPVGHAELLDVLAEMFLQLDEEGVVPGRARVSASLYRIVLRQGVPGDALTVECEEGELSVADAEALRCDAEVDHHHEVDEHGHEIDVTTPPELRKEVLLRDGQRCRACRSRQRLMAHHVKFRAQGGRTEPSNLLTLRSPCHGLVHAGLLTVIGTDAAVATFVGADRAPLAAPAGAYTPRDGRLLPAMQRAEPLGGAPGRDAAPAPPGTTLDGLPEEVDGAWWRRNAHLLRVGADGLELHDGVALPEVPARAPVAGDAARGPRLGELVGQESLAARLFVAAKGSRARGRPFPHLLLLGAPGTGKTTVAREVAELAGGRLVQATGPLIHHVGDLLLTLAALEAGDVLFLEEAHAVPRPVLEALYQAQSEQRVSLLVRSARGDGRVRHVTLNLPPFTLVAATSEEGRLPEPFVSRFGLSERLGPYSTETLAEIAARRARSEGVLLDADAATHLASRAHATPRSALRLVERLLEEAAAAGLTRVDRETVAAVLLRLGYDAQGLAPLEQRYLALLQRLHRPVSLARLALTLGTDAQTLERFVEPRLFELGLIDVTPRGRVALPDPDLSDRPDKSVVRSPGQPVRLAAGG
jgi:holliday junction DNA helicase RuvB